MQKLRLLNYCLTTACAALLWLAPAPASSAAPALPSASFAALPLSFEPFPGAPASRPAGPEGHQFAGTDAGAPGLTRFLSRGPGYLFQIAPSGAQLVLTKSAVPALTSLQDRAPALTRPPTISRTLRMEFSGANPRARAFPETPLSGKINYLIGSDPGQWRTGVTTYAKVRVEQLYPGIDLVYYGNQRQLEFDFVVAPGADPEAIAIRYDGADRVALTDTGDVLLALGSDEVRQPLPVLYQTVDGQRKPVSGAYQLKDACTIAFKTGQYDRSLPLTIDPTLNYSTYFGGNGNDILWSVKVNPADNSVYVAGQTQSGQFPFTVPPGGFQQINASAGNIFTNRHLSNINGDAFVAKLDSTGTNLLFFTFLGGTNDDSALDLALDAAGNAYITGYTDSGDFPVAPPTGVPGLTNSTNLGGDVTPAHVKFSDAFVAELSSDGASLIFSTFLGGAQRDAGIGIALDPGNFVYVTGYTYSTNFPATNAIVAVPFGSTDPVSFNTLRGSNDVFVTKFAPAGAGLVYSTYLGGTNFDVGQGITADSDGNAYITGYTASTNFPVTTALAPLLGQLNDTTNAWRKYFNKMIPQYDAFVAKIAPLGADLLYCAYLGGTNNDSGFRIRLDPTNGVYITGSSSSVDFPLVPPGATNIIQHGRTNIHFFNGDAFLTKIVSSNNVPVIQYSSLFGGTRDETGWDLAVDPVTANVFVVGATLSTNFPVFPISATNVPFLMATNRTRSNDVFVASFAVTPFDWTNFTVFFTNVNGHFRRMTNSQVMHDVGFTNLYAVTLGGLRDDFGLGIDVDAAGNAFVVGQTVSGDFTTLNPLQPNLVGTSDGFLAKIQFADALSAVTIDTVPPGLVVIVDGVAQTAPFTTDWVVGSLHSLSNILVQAGGPGVRFVWNSWSDDGPLAHQVIPRSPTLNLTANFTTQFFLTMNATAGGGVNPASDWFDAGSAVPITATPAHGASFSGWTGTGPGSFTGATASGTVTMDGPIAELATFTATPGNVLTLVVNGAGSVSPDLDGQTLQVGHTYTFTATPRPGNAFTGWTGTFVTNSPALIFKVTNGMPDGLVVEANFTTNLFTPVQGTYSGLFFDTNNIDFRSSGFFTAALTDNRAFSASITVAGRTFGLSGRFDDRGAFTGSISRGSLLSRLQVRLQLDLSGGNRITGQISDGIRIADLLALRSTFSTANPAPQSGRKYILRFPGSDNSLAAPGGDSFGSATVDATGKVLFNGTLSDGSKITQAALVSATGQWPFFVSFSTRGAIMGWLSFDLPAGNVINGPVFWFKSPNPGRKRLYPGGFTFQTAATGAAYNFTGGRVLNFSQGQLILENGGLERNITNLVSLDANNRVFNLTTSQPLTLSINPASGLFQGTFFNPNTRRSVAFNGALLPNLTNGTGFFLTTNQSGRVFFGPAPTP